MDVGDLVEVQRIVDHDASKAWKAQLGIITRLTTHNAYVYVASQKKELLLCQDVLTVVKKGKPRKKTNA